MKKIVLYSDGTGNSAGNPHKTNVWRAYQALDKSLESGQVAFYDNGVGTNSFRPTAILGLAFGWGHAKNVKQIYRFLCKSYEKDNSEIYCFGFSRGAFTIRVVAALIASQGIIDKEEFDNDLELDRMIASAYRQYRKESFTPSVLSWALAPLRDRLLNLWHRKIRKKSVYDATRNIRYIKEPKPDGLIKCIGVWDTVDAYGGPIDELTRAWDKVVWPLIAKDRDLSPRVERAYQALALDEQRESFEPMLWNEENATDEERITQIWFSGVHSNVGGGYPDDGLAKVSLNWMLDESAKEGGLQYIDSIRESYRKSVDPLGSLYDSRGGLGNTYRYAPRNLERICNSEKPGLANWMKQRFKVSSAVKNAVVIKKPKIHASVFDRILRGGDSYAPINVPCEFSISDLSGENKQLEELCNAVKSSTNRMHKQKLIWGLVWERKVLYTLTVIAVLVLIAYPYFPKTEGEDKFIKVLQPILGTLGYYVGLIPGLIGKLPGFEAVGSWVREYEQYPTQFAIFLGSIGLLLGISHKLKLKINAGMRLVWSEIQGTKKIQDGTSKLKKGSRAKLHSLVSSVIDSQVYKGSISKYVRVIVESIFILVFLVLLFSLTSRIVYTTVDGLGGVCSKVSEVNKEFGKEFSFPASNPCFDTGLIVKNTDKYQIEMLVDQSWKDKTISADLDGLIDAPWYMALFAPFRRHFSVDWFQPVFKVGETLFDRHPIMRDVPHDKKDEPRVYWVTFLEPNKSGRLFLYLNDAVIFVPDLSRKFYSNNDGNACLRIQNIEKINKTNIKEQIDTGKQSDDIEMSKEIRKPEKADQTVESPEAAFRKLCREMNKL